MTHEERQEEIRSKKFNMNFQENISREGLDFSNIRIGTKSLDDAVLNLGSLKKLDSRMTDKNTVLTAIRDGNQEELRQISNFFYKTSGIYSRLCRYLAFLYRYDWMITPYIVSDSLKEEKVLSSFDAALAYLDNFELKKFFNQCALQVIKNGSYYGYLIRNGANASVQELPANYCRSRFSVNSKPAIEFDMKFFDDSFRDTSQKMRMLNLFPKEFKKGYVLFKEGKLTGDYAGDKAGWYLLDPEAAFRFSMDEECTPMMVTVIPAIIDLDAAKDLDRQKMAQQLLKIVIQTLPLDKNGDLIFDIDEGRELHNNVVAMLGRAIGIDVLTTFADIKVADMAESKASQLDELTKVERAVYNEAGISQKQFNTDGNLALEKSIANDAATLNGLVMQFESFINYLLKPYNTAPKKLYFKAQILPTTIYNYQDLSKMYKEQVVLGYSMMLPQIALGQSQSAILATAHFENEILQLFKVFVPPMSSNTMSSDVISNIENSNGETGRTELDDDEKSEKTIANKESMS